MEDSKKVVNKVRKVLANQGCVLHKSRAKNWSLNNQGEYLVLDAYHNAVICGSNFDFSIDDVIQWFKLDI